jgi:hypothetical protein
MENKFERIETEDYILAVSEEGVKKGDFFVTDKGTVHKAEEILDCDDDGEIEIHSENHCNPKTLCKKIIAYQPKGNAPELLPIVQYGNMTFKELNGDGSYYECIDCEVETTRSGEFLKSQGVELYKNNTPELDLPLLPEIVVEDEVEKLALLRFPISMEDFGHEKIDGNAYFRSIFIEGYKATTKVYSEEDVFGFLEYYNSIDFNKSEYRYRHPTMDGKEKIYNKAIDQKIFKEYIQSLKQSKPKWFVAETIPNFPKMPINGKDFPFIDVLKTTTINGKTYLVGTYLNE